MPDTDLHAPALQAALLDTVRRTITPLFLIQAQNDFSLAPMEGHGFFSTGIPTGIADVERFLGRWLSSPMGG